MTANELKRLLCEYIYYKGDTLCAFTEFCNADVAALRNNLFVVEYEIKVDRYDLQHELNTIHWILTKEDIGKGSKSTKHWYYLEQFKKGNFMGFFNPNYFYFVVPPELETQAVEGVKGTPYGVMSVLHDRFPHVVVPVKRLHGNVASQGLVASILRKGFNETVALRQKLVASNGEKFETKLPTFN